VRFVLQRKFNRMIGKNRQGDRAVLSIIDGQYIEPSKFDSEVKPSDLPIQMSKAVGYLTALGIKAGVVEHKNNIADYIKTLRASGANGVLLVSGEQDAGDHTYALFEFQDVGSNLEAKIYNPWTGTLRPAPATPDQDWCDVIAFQNNFAIPVDDVGNPLPRKDPTGSFIRDDQGNKLFLRPGQPTTGYQTAEIFYEFLFAPLI
jgi:hypothetical protein